MKERIIALLLALCLIVGLVPAVFAEEEVIVSESGTCGENLTWRYEEVYDSYWYTLTATLYIEGNGAMHDYALGENGKTTAPWSELGWEGEIDNVVLDSGVTYIGKYAFYGVDIKNIELLSSNVTEIGSHAFAGNNSCGLVVLPDGLTRIEDNLFANASQLEMVYIQESVTAIGNGAFSGTAIENLNVPETVTSVGTGAFAGIPGPIWFNGKAPAFAADAFAGYTGTIYYPADDPTWAETVQNVSGSHTWTLTTDLASGICGENLTWRLTGLTLYIEGEGDMYDYGTDTTDRAPWRDLSFTYLELGHGVTSIGNDAFIGCRDLRFTNLGESNVRRIGSSAFGHTQLIQETIPEGVTVLEETMFFSVRSLWSVTLPESLVSIEDAAFADSGLKKLTIPRNVKSLGDSVFDYVRNTEIRFTGDAPAMTEDTFSAFDGIIYYPGNNPTWTEVITGEHTSWYTWIPYTANPFSDVPAGEFYEQPVLWALENNITTGATATTFNPDGQCQRAQVVTFLHRAAKNPEPTSTKNPFSDVKASDFFYKPVLWAVEKGITNGTGGNKFGSYDVCNRAAVVTFLWRAAGSPEPKTTQNPFKDVKTSDFFYKPVLWAVENGITNGVDASHFGPTSPCNRAQVVTFLYRAYN